MYSTVARDGQSQNLCKTRRLLRIHVMKGQLLMYAEWLKSWSILILLYSSDATYCTEIENLCLVKCTYMSVVTLKLCILLAIIF